MGTRCAPNYAIIFMAELEEDYLDTCIYKPTLWKRFIDDIFMIWQHGSEKLIRSGGRRSRVGSASDCRAGGQWFKSQHPTSAETRMWGRRLAAMLALYTGKCVAPEVNLRERRSISCTPPQSSNKAEPTLALKPRGDITRSPKQGYQWPHKWTCVQQKF